MDGGKGPYGVTTVGYTVYCTDSPTFEIRGVSEEIEILLLALVVALA